MLFERKSKHKILLLVIFLSFLIIGFLIYSNIPPQPVSCTEEAKLCPDGSAVGRTGPNCEFEECPFKVFNEKGIYFKYPEKLYTQHIRVIDWPPQVNIVEDDFSCTEAGSEIDRAGKTEMKTINGKDYCVTKVSEGAAGSIYTQYAYAFEKDSKTIIFTFSLKFVQCANYDETEKDSCEIERNNFDIDKIIIDVIESAKID